MTMHWSMVTSVAHQPYPIHRFRPALRQIHRLNARYHSPGAMARPPSRGQQYRAPIVFDNNNFLDEFYSHENNRYPPMSAPFFNGHSSRPNKYNRNPTFDRKPFKSNANIDDQEQDFYNSHFNQFDSSEQNGYKDGHHHGPFDDIHVHQAAVISSHKHKTYRVPPKHHRAKPTVINLEGRAYPVILNFDSMSSPLLTNHHHHASEAHHKNSYSLDHAHTHVHTISKPVVHEVREVISPYRNVYRVVEPVKEQVNTFVHEAHHDYAHSGANYNGRPPMFHQQQASPPPMVNSARYPYYANNGFN